MKQELTLAQCLIGYKIAGMCGQDWGRIDSRNLHTGITPEEIKTITGIEVTEARYVCLPSINNKGAISGWHNTPDGILLKWLVFENGETHLTVTSKTSPQVEGFALLSCQNNVLDQEKCGYEGVLPALVYLLIGHIYCPAKRVNINLVLSGEITVEDIDRRHNLLIETVDNAQGERAVVADSSWRDFDDIPDTMGYSKGFPISYAG